MLITLINGESRRTFTAQRSADDTEVRLTRVRDPSSVPNLPDNHTTIRLPEHSTIIRFGGGSSSSSGSSSNRRVPLNPTLAATRYGPALAAAQNEAYRVLERLERNVRAMTARQHQNHHQEPFEYSHTRRPDNPREHFTIVPSWAVKAEDKRGQCNVCFEENTHLQIKCIKCNNQCVCCKCVIGIYRHINPCPMCRHRGER